MSKRFEQWAALSPWSIISFSLGTIKLILNNGYALIPVVYTGWQQGFNSPWVIVVLAATVIAVFSFSSLQWAKYRYRLQEDKLGIRQGLIFKKNHQIPLNKIQNVRLVQPLYFRPMGLYSLVVETAGSKKDEAVLAAVNYRQAMQLKRALFSQQEQANSASSEAATQADQPVRGITTTLVTKSVKDLILFGLYQNNLFWFSVISGSILGQLDWEQLEQSQIKQTIWQWYETTIAVNIITQVVFALALLVTLYLLLSLISIASAILKYHPYQLARRHDTIHRSGGLLAKQNDSLALSRVQLIEFSQPVIGKLLQLWTINFKQVKGNEVEQMAKRHMLIPSMKRQQIDELMPKLNGLAATATVLPTHYRGIHIGWFWRRAWLAPLIALLNTLFIGINPFTETLLFIAAVVTALIYARYRQWGYLLQADNCWIHTGVLGQSWQLVSLKKVQHVCITQTPGQRKRQLATLTLGLASGEQHIPYIPLKDARQIAETALQLTQQDHHNWI
ncbi:PH domain-containing protein [Shewanella colwelliana]|uniref:PH domain-containing protein n=1 Tax=Shewanella colwelliana TaxID=23 RepID=UPI003735A6E0